MLGHKESMRTHIVYRLKMGIDLVLFIVFAAFAGLWCVQSISTILITQNIFATMNLYVVGFPMHAMTTLNLSALYLVNIFVFRTFLPGHLRVVRALLFTTLGVFFYDFTWSVCSVAINGYGSFIIPLVSFVVVLMYMIIIHFRQTHILKFNAYHVALVLIIYLTTLGIFVISGFFQQYALFEHGLASDPHGWAWLLNKTVALWMWLVLALR